MHHVKRTEDVGIIHTYFGVSGANFMEGLKHVLLIRQFQARYLVAARNTPLMHLLNRKREMNQNSLTKYG